MTITIVRRQFISALGGAAVAWPLAARAQQPAIPVVGFLNSGSAAERVPLVAAFINGLSESGFIEGRSVLIEYRWADGDYHKLAAMVADLVRSRVAVIAATGGTGPGVAAKQATSTIPIVFTGGSDPVKLGLVASLNRPGGNATGVINLGGALGAKRLGLLQQLIPNATAIGLLVNPSNLPAESQLRDVQDAARKLGREIKIVNASSANELGAAFQSLVHLSAESLVVDTDAFFITRRYQIAALASHHSIPTIYFERSFADAGGLLSYGTSFKEIYRQAGAYTARILKGEKPADLPVLQPTKFELVINLKTAKALGLEIPPQLLALADEVIE